MPLLRRRSFVSLLSIALAAVLLGTAPSHAQSVEEEIAALKKGQAELAKQLAQLRQLLAASMAQGRTPAPSGADIAGKVFDLGDSPVKGVPGARVTLIEFTDYQCPFCSRHVVATLPEIKRKYLDTGKIRYATLDMPIPSLHPLAQKAAEATHCARDQGKFWEMHDELFANQKALEPFARHAEKLGLDPVSFAGCLGSGKHAGTVRRNLAEAAKAGVVGTPSFVVGLADEKDPAKVHGLKLIRGAHPFPVFEAALDFALTSVAIEDR